MTARPSDCAGPARLDADGRCFTTSGDPAHVREIIRRHRLSKGDKPAAAEREAGELAAKLFDQEVPR
jgi:hypothetical protein